jgi:hypothetical protein
MFAEIGDPAALTLEFNKEIKVDLLPLPDQGTLVRIVREALDDVATTAKLKTGYAGWAGDIGDAIERRLANLRHPGIECAYGGRKRGEDSELLFDFCALLYERADPKNEERYPMRTLIVGEIECHDGLRKDFEKLPVADPLVYFFVLPEKLRLGENMNALDFFQSISQRRCQYAARSGMTPPPAFIIASHSAINEKFEYRSSADPGRATKLTRSVRRGGQLRRTDVPHPDPLPTQERELEGEELGGRGN